MNWESEEEIQLGLKNSVFVLASTIVGAGVLSLPYTFQVGVYKIDVNINVDIDINQDKSLSRACVRMWAHRGSGDQWETEGQRGAG